MNSCFADVTNDPCGSLAEIGADACKGANACKGIARALGRAMLWGLMLAAVSGCASWSNWKERDGVSDGDPAPASPLKKVTRAIELEARFVQIQYDPEDPDQLQSMWQWVDETVVPIETRHVLQRNGLRVGKAVQPERLTQRLQSLQADDARDVVQEFLTSASVSSHQAEGSKVIPMRIGKRYELPVRLPIQGEHVVMIHEEPQPVGKTLLDPQFLIALTPQLGDSPAGIRLRVRPEVQHGQMRQDWVKGDAALRIDVRRQSWSLDMMEFELAGGEGDFFVLAESSPRVGLGREMLGGKNVDQMEQQTVVLLRINNVPTPSEKL